MIGLSLALRPGIGACVLFAFVVAAAGCEGSKQSLTDQQLGKLDPALRSLLQEGDSGRRLSSTTRSDGTVAYAVFIRATDAEQVREAGIPVNSTSGKILTARLSTKEIRKAARLDAVTSIERSGEATQHAN